MDISTWASRMEMQIKWLRNHKEKTKMKFKTHKILWQIVPEIRNLPFILNIYSVSVELTIANLILNILNSDNEEDENINWEGRGQCVILPHRKKYSG